MTEKTITPENVTDPLPEHNHETPVNMPALNLAHGGVVFIDPDQVTHVQDKTINNTPGASVGTVGGVIVDVLHTAEEIARLFGWIE